MHKNIIQELLTADVHFVCRIPYNSYYILQVNSVVSVYSFYIAFAVTSDQMTDTKLTW